MASTQKTFQANFATAWASFLTLIQTASVGITYSTLTISWTRGSLPQGSVIRWEFTDVASPVGTSVIETWIQDLHSTVTAPLSYIMGPLVGQTTIRKQITPGAVITPDQYAAAVMATIGLILIDVCGATLVVGSALDAPGTNPSYSWGSSLSMVAYTATDVWPYSVFVISESAKWGNAVLYNSQSGIFGIAALQTVAIEAQSQSQQLIPDFEVGINNGSSIYSVSSNTFTEP